MTEKPPLTGGSTVTIGQLVGRNLKLARESRGWDWERLADEAEILDIDWDASAVAGFEQGTRDVTVSDLVTLGIMLGIAPHLLMYPEPNTIITLGANQPDAVSGSAGMEDAILFAETHVTAVDLANWIWSPDEHRYTHAGVSEGDLWAAVEQGLNN